MIQEKLFIKEICDGREEEEEEEEENQHRNISLNLSDGQLHKYLDLVTHSCNEMLLKCEFEGHERDCAEIFNPVITDGGQCCGFNVMPEPLMFRKSESKLSSEEKSRWANWDIEDGYGDVVTEVKEDCANKEKGSSVGARHKRSSKTEEKGGCNKLVKTLFVELINIFGILFKVEK